MNLADFDHFNEEDEENEEDSEEGWSPYYELLHYEFQSKVERESILLKGLDDYVKMRRRYGRWILSITYCWILAVLAVVFLQGFQGLQYYLGPKFYLSDSILITLLGTTTANVIGLFIIVAKYLFPDNARDLIDPSSISK